MYIIVTDDKGFQVGRDSGVFKPAEHRVLIDKKNMFGVEGLFKYFRDDNNELDENEWSMFVGLLQTLPTGTYGRLKWERETD